MSSKGTGRARYVTLALAVVGALLVWTLRGTETPSRADLTLSDLPCQRDGYPCTWDEVEPAVVEATKRLGEVSVASLIHMPDLRELAGFLAGVEGMAEVAIDGDALRFRLEGGRPAWVVLPDELDHHFTGRSPRAPAGTANGPPATSTESRRRLARLWTPRILHAAGVQETPTQSVAGTPGEGKHALVLAPFEHELRSTAEVVRAIELVRDYRQENGGSVTWHADLYALDDNRLPSGVGGPSSEVVLKDFLDWDERDLSLIVVFTHGGRVACNRPIPRGGDTIDNSTLYEGPRCPLIVAGRAKQEDYGNRLGVELFYWGNPIVSPVPPPDPDTRYDSPDDRGWYEGTQTHPGLTPSERVWCWERQEEGENATTAGGKPCFVDVWLHDRPMIALWTPFFRSEYPNGLEDTVVMLAACYSGYGEILPRVLAPPSSKGVTVMGFDSVTMEDDALYVIDQAVRLIDKGYHSDALLSRLLQLDRSGLLTGRSLDAGDEAPTGRPPDIVEISPDAVHGRDPVQLNLPGGPELEHGGTVRLVGLAGDGQPDSLELRATLAGVTEANMLPQVRFTLTVVGERSGSPFRPVWTESGIDDVFWHRLPVPLGRDADDGEIVALEIEARLPGGDVSRWRYRDIELIVPPPCGFEAEVTGGRMPGTHRGPARVLGNVLVLSDLESGWTANVVLPITQGGPDRAGGAWRPGALEPGAYPTDMEMEVARVPIENDTAVFMATSGGSGTFAEGWASLRIEGVEGAPAGSSPDDGARLVGEVEAHLGWMEFDDRASFVDVRLRFDAVPFGSGPGSAYRRCRDAWLR